MKDEPVTMQVQERAQWRLERAVLVYAPDSRNPFKREAERAYATLHQVIGHRKGLRLGAGVPATREACADLAKALGANASLGGFVPPQLLYIGARSLIWWRPPGQTRVFFDTTGAAAGDQANDKTAAAAIGKRNGLVPHPGLVFAVTGARKWYVHALKGKDRPDADSDLFRAPYFNVYANGAVCTGNVRLPETLSAQRLVAYEKAFFDSEFTHPNVRGREKLIHYSSGPYGFWADYLKAWAAPDFPVQHLVDVKLTLAGLANRLEKGKDE